MKKEFKFKIGDRVKCIKPFGSNEQLVGKIGTIKIFDNVHIGVQFDEKFYEGHNLNGRVDCPIGHGWYGHEEEVELLDEKRECELKVGDRVRCIKPFDSKRSLVGKCGTIREIKGEKGGSYEIGVQFDGRFEHGHDLDGRCPDGYGRWGARDALELIIEAEVEELWRPEPEKCKESEYVNSIPFKYKYVARDKDGKLFAYVEKPIIDIGGQQWYGKECKVIDKGLFKDLKFNDEPRRIN